MIKREYSLKYRRQKEEKKRNGAKGLALFVGLLCFLIAAGKFLALDGYEKVKYQTCYASLQNISPILMASYKEKGVEDERTEYDTTTESQLEYEVLLPESGQTKEDSSQTGQAAVSATASGALQDGQEESQAATSADPTAEAATENGKQKATVPMDKLQDFDYLIQHFYTVDSMTTITSDRLNADMMLGVDCKLQQDASKPQILIYHTHSQEGYKDSTQDPSTRVVGVGDRLTELLTKKGYSVLHHKGTYDVKDRDNAYSNVAPALQQLLAENPSIEVVIDLHRDGVPESAHLVSEVDGRPTAQIMFFNGLSYTTAVGDIDYLYNPYRKENLAFSLQLQLAATEQFPGFARPIYLKGYRYNLHFRPKSILVEVGAQTNTVEEAMNAMEPLAEILDTVLKGKY